MTGKYRIFLTSAWVTAAILMHPPCPSSGTDLDHRFSGELSGWALGALAEKENTWNVGARYLPAFSINTESDGGNLLDLYIYLNAFGAASSVDEYDDYKLDLYRLVFRYTTHR